MPTSLNEKDDPRNHDRGWVNWLVAFSVSVILLGVLAVAIRNPSAGKWISDAAQAELGDPNAPSDVNTAEQPRTVIHAAKAK
jgi:hypothetical protein